MKKKVPTSLKGFGSIYRPTYTDRHGVRQRSSGWHAKYRTDSGPVRRNLKTADQQQAYEELVKIAGQRISGSIRSARAETVTCGELLDLLLQHYKTKKTYTDVECRVRRQLRPEFGAVRVRDLRRAHLDAFIRKLEADKKEPSTINRYLSNLHKALELGRDHELVTIIPKFPWRDERGNIRQGFFDEKRYHAMRDELGRTAPHAALALVIAYHTGLRRGEVLGLRRDQVDLKAELIRLEGIQTKNGRQRSVPIWGEMWGFIEMAEARYEKESPASPWLISFQGERVHSLKTAWKRACEKLGIDGALFHDLRRTALSNMEEAGTVARSTAMEISGHKTPSAYRRYLIGSERRAAAAGRSMDEWSNKKKEQAAEKAAIELKQ